MDADCKRFACHECGDLVGKRCEHTGTDGTIACPDCGIGAGEFIAAAGEWLADNDGAETDDPGYFEG
jgi:hypothetical protein